MTLDSPEAVREALAGERYLADRGLSTSVFLAASLEQPLLLEGEAGLARPRWPVRSRAPPARA